MTGLLPMGQQGSCGSAPLPCPPSLHAVRLPVDRRLQPHLRCRITGEETGCRVAPQTTDSLRTEIASRCPADGGSWVTPPNIALSDLVGFLTTVTPEELLSSTSTNRETISTGCVYQPSQQHPLTKATRGEPSQFTGHVHLTVLISSHAHVSN